MAPEIRQQITTIARVCKNCNVRHWRGSLHTASCLCGGYCIIGRDVPSQQAALGVDVVGFSTLEPDELARTCFPNHVAEGQCIV